MHRHQQAMALVAAAVLISSCSDSDARWEMTQPSFVGGSFVAVAAASSTAFAQPTNNPICPSIAPFNVAFGITVRANGSSNVIIAGVRFRFTDFVGSPNPADYSADAPRDDRRTHPDHTVRVRTGAGRLGHNRAADPRNRVWHR